MKRGFPRSARRPRNLLAAAVLVLAGCVGLAPDSQDFDAKEFRPLPDKGVIYLVRGEPLYSDRPVPVWLGDFKMLVTYPDTFFRWEVQPGAHRISGHEADFGTITVAAEPGRVYFVMQQLSYRHDISYFTMIEELEGRAAVRRAALLKAN